MVATSKQMSEKVKAGREESRHQPADMASQEEETFVLSERDGRLVASLLESPPKLSKGLKKAIDAKYD